MMQIWSIAAGRPGHLYWHLYTIESILHICVYLQLCTLHVDVRKVDMWNFDVL